MEKNNHRDYCSPHQYYVYKGQGDKMEVEKDDAPKEVEYKLYGKDADGIIARIRLRLF